MRHIVEDITRIEEYTLDEYAKLTGKTDPVLAELWDNARDASYDRIYPRMDLLDIIDSL